MAAWLASTAAGAFAAASDSTVAAPPAEKVASRSAWETAASVPTTILLAPFYIVTKGAGAVVGVVEQTRIVNKTLDFLVADDGSRSIFPTYDGKTGFGARYVQRNLAGKGSRLAVTATAGLNERRYVEAALDRVPLGSPRLTGRVTALHFFWSDEPFFGVGQDTDESDETSYALEQTSAQLAVTWNPRARIAVDANLVYEHNDAGPGGDPNSSTTQDPTLAGVPDRVNLMQLRLGFLRDGLDHPGRPTKGSAIACVASVVAPTEDQDLGFMRFEADVSRYVHLFHGRTLRLRAAASVAEPFSGNQIPFYELAELGGRETLRGFERGRFHDQGSLLGSVEYRYPIQPRLMDAVFFADVGRVFADLGKDEVEDAVHSNFGVGLRAWDRGGVLMTFDVGFSREGTFVKFAFNP